VNLTDQELLRESAVTYGRKIDVNPYKVLIDEVKWRLGHVEYLREQIQRTSFDSLFIEDDHGVMHEGPLLLRYDTERKHLDKVCNIAARLGVAERYVGLAELQGRVIFDALRAALDDPRVGLDEGQRTALVDALRRTMVSTNGSTPHPQLPQVPT